MINIKYKKNPLLGSGYLDCGFEPLDSLLLYYSILLVLLFSYSQDLPYYDSRYHNI